MYGSDFLAAVDAWTRATLMVADGLTLRAAAAHPVIGPALREPLAAAMATRRPRDGYEVAPYVPVRRDWCTPPDTAQALRGVGRAVAPVTRKRRR